MTDRQELEAKIARQKHELYWLQAANERRNMELDALYQVWCSGGCEGGVKFGREVTPEMVAFVKQYARRLEQWFVSHEGRVADPRFDDAPARRRAWERARERLAALEEGEP